MDFGLEELTSILNPLDGRRFCQCGLHLGVLSASQASGQVLHKHLLQNPQKSAWKQLRSDPTLPQTFLLPREHWPARAPASSRTLLPGFLLLEQLSRCGSAFAELAFQWGEELRVEGLEASQS